MRYESSRSKADLTSGIVDEPGTAIVLLALDLNEIVARHRLLLAQVSSASRSLAGVASQRRR